ncbi:MAG TPA: Crp/Fnr family transcriptional regulator [Bacteroidales bacterium]|nr:Crp/Fnr family transcriptional regulator [Bacteroidales bacterium]HRZ49100.1 Crp/Fnr family transcriptional regulator [Bacteroidales bacterium]
MRQEKEPEKITDLIESLTERRKELSCIYQVNDLLRDYTVDLQGVFIELSKILPDAWRYADICRACVMYEGEQFEYEPFVKTKLKQTAPITLEDHIVGEIQIYYIKPVTNEKGIFLKEEQRLLNTVADKLSGFILLKRLKETVNRQQESPAPVPPDQQYTVNKWLSGIGLTEDQIIRCTRVKIDFRKGETICKQGALNAYIMIFAEGMAKAYLEGYQEKGLNFKVIQPFDLIGLTSVKGTNCYRYSVSGITPCKVYLVDKEEFLSMAASNRVLQEYLLEFYCNLAGDMLNRLNCVANKQAPGRVADVLLYLANDVFKSPYIPNVISRKDIAELAGMSTESAVRILSELKSDGIIKIVKDGIELIRPELIRTISIAG